MTHRSRVSLKPWLDSLQRARRLYVGYSGGLDSTVLLDLVAGSLGAGTFTAVHVDHGLSPRSGQWARHCEEFCNNRGIPLLSRTVSVRAAGEGVEQAARDARYAVFAELLEPGDALVLAHHADDQVETLLYRLLRGSGPAGLKGMPARRSLGRGELLRPLLDVSRADLEAYARQRELLWIEDESNADNAYDRNYLRNALVPVLAVRWPDYRQRFLRSADQCGRADRLMREAASTDLGAADERPERLGWSLSLESFARLSPERQGNLLRFWAERRGLAVPGHGAVDAVPGQLVAARDDAQPLVAWQGAQLRRFRHRLYLLPELAPPADTALPWSGEEPLRLPDGSELSAQRVTGAGLWIPPDAVLSVQFRRGGERCKPAGRAGSAPLKKLLQEYGLPPWLRDRVPLLYVDATLAAVGDLFPCEDFAAGPDQPGILPVWQYPSRDGD